MTAEQKKAVHLMFVGGMIGLGLPFAIAGMALQITGNVLRVEIVKEVPIGASTLVRDPVLIKKLCNVANPVRPFRLDTSTDGHRVCTEVDE